MNFPITLLSRGGAILFGVKARQAETHGITNESEA